VAVVVVVCVFVAGGLRDSQFDIAAAFTALIFKKPLLSDKE
jgi:hypothetical protein